MKQYKWMIIIGLVLAGLAIILAACGTNAPAPTLPPPSIPTNNPATQQQSCPTAAACPVAPTAEAPAQPAVDVPNLTEWEASAHADKTATAFNDWNDADPKEVPATCAKCHSTPGFQDFVGADGSAVGKVDKGAPIGTVITCVACHNSGTAQLNTVTFPSGAVITDTVTSVVCMQCHQGRASKQSVDDAVTKAALTDPDTPSDKLGFVNIHYFAAAATLYGSQAHGGYEYNGQVYDTKFQHVNGFQTCADCHNTHSLEVKVDSCKTCHTNVASKDDLQNIRMAGSEMDYNGNGDTKEGIAKEIQGLQGMLLQAIQAYGKDVAKTQIAYSAEAYPYFFVDKNGNGTADQDEATSDNKYNAWTPRLLEAAYNYQTSIKDPGAFAHNAKYVIELLYDSTADLNTKLATQVDLSKAHRQDAGHFSGTDEQWRHWDEEGSVPGDCAKCHSATGLPIFLAEAARSRDGVTGNVTSQPLSNGLMCKTCHNDLTSFTRETVNQVKFPSGAVLGFGDAADANLCIECHQGRESKVSVAAAIQKSGVKSGDEVTDKLSFRNPHYFAAGATLFGTQAQGAFEFDGQKYDGQFGHTQGFTTCTDCHDAHTQEVKVEACSGCHGTKTAEDLQNIRMPQWSPDDYNGNGKKDEGVAQEVKGMQDALLAAIQGYATKTAKVAIVYDPAAYPYFFADANANGKVDEGEEAYATWTSKLLQSAYNLQWSVKDPGSFAHNGHYIMQVLYDSIKNMGGDVSKMVRPAVTAPAQ